MVFLRFYMVRVLLGGGRPLLPPKYHTTVADNRDMGTQGYSQAPPMPPPQTRLRIHRMRTGEPSGGSNDQPTSTACSAVGGLPVGTWWGKPRKYILSDELGYASHNGLPCSTWQNICPNVVLLPSICRCGNFLILIPTCSVGILVWDSAIRAHIEPWWCALSADPPP